MRFQIIFCFHGLGIIINFVIITYYIRYASKKNSMKKRYSIGKIINFTNSKDKLSEEIVACFDIVNLNEENSEEDDVFYEIETIKLAYDLIKEVLKEVIHLMI